MGFSTELHDHVIINLINNYKPKNILDYGAGKCKIARALPNYKFSVYDIDHETLDSRAPSSARVYHNSNEIENDYYDMVINNLVLCCVNNNIADDILNDIRLKLKVNGKLILSICNPFFNTVKNTELRYTGLNGNYNKASIYHKHTKVGTKLRDEYHRPIEYYINLFSRYGFEINNIFEGDGMNVDTLNEIGEHLIFDLTLVNKNTMLEDLSLLIKANPMEANIIYDNVKNIVLNLEKNICFKSRIITIDNIKMDRERRYADDDLELLISEIERLKINGLIDEIITLNDSDYSLYEKYFNLKSNNPHSLNGQGLLATIKGFDRVKTRLVFQTDSDIIYHINDLDFKEAYSLAKTKLSVSLSILHDHCEKPNFGGRIEVRSSFINLDILKEMLPMPNRLVNGIFENTWHRTLDNIISKEESIRMYSNKNYFIHPENKLKTIQNFLSKVKLAIEKNNYPTSQIDNVNLVNDDYSIKNNNKVIIYIRGYNTKPEYLRRLFKSLKMQDYQDFSIVYVDDASTNESKDYALFNFKYDTYFKDKVTYIFNETNVGELANFCYVMDNVIVNDDSIIINVDNDDFFMVNNAISRILKEFNEGAEITCGNCFRSDKPTKKYEIKSFEKSWERDGDNIWLHPKCFKKRLYKFIDKDVDLKIDGQFVKVNTDYAFMLPMIEESKKCVFIKDVIYYFDPSNDNKTNSGMYSNKKEIRDKLLEEAKVRHEKKNNCSNR